LNEFATIHDVYSRRKLTFPSRHSGARRNPVFGFFSQCHLAGCRLSPA
jgi:hypothetical protein